MPMNEKRMNDTIKRMHKWGMVIDLDRCTGCQACMAACHAENNIAIIGPDESVKGRTIHWIELI